MTNDKQTELDYILGSVEFHERQVREFVKGLGFPETVAILGYLTGIIEAQVPDLIGTVPAIANLIRDEVYPTMAAQESAPAPEGALRMYYPRAVPTSAPAEKPSILLH